MHQQSVTVRAWVPDLRTGMRSPLRHDLMLERIGVEVDGSTQFRVLDPDGGKPCSARFVLETPLFERMQRHGVHLDGSPEPWRMTTSLADANANGQLVLFLRGPRGDSPTKAAVMALTTADGVVFMVERKTDARGTYFDVRDRGDFPLGHIRLTSKTTTECLWNVSVQEGYAAEIVQQLRNQEEGMTMDDVIETLMKACGALGIAPPKPFRDVHDFEAQVLQTWPAAGEPQKMAQLRYILQAVREAEAHRVAGVAACLRHVKTLS